MRAGQRIEERGEADDELVIGKDIVSNKEITTRTERGKRR